ncbi:MULTISPECIES: hypothetical protein [unclassified Paenibacillus]|uniref:hypothetical protein n=1 Tax=unclassified Paenibacillus TaxID=185978 RepID=UPI0024059574|nr:MULTISPECIES: hypothetical protein [unclassified Paenibacillus]MDF9844726.1 hypothetical protein [Paenibacillus sp. PastF-2]MDF9851328.1 hypothetical protein [Paenibacillus sp. PastM-2]MDF9857910.1 hypothetical protein [Paenibacillus sp. PastF-1]MDH6483177.1 hypothetical protein [Paenibacillus sp. PastH-2]MDH6510567.1 hypothetical protein [Paenibacillus sp. PastM-3]
MTITKNEKSGFDNVINTVFYPVFEDCKDEIQIILDADSVIRSKVEERVTRILKNRVLKKAINSEAIVQGEKSKEYSGIQYSTNTPTYSENKVVNDLGSQFIYISPMNERTWAPWLHVYNKEPKALEGHYVYSFQEAVSKETKASSERSDLALAI